jgi:hypothetical protein
MQIIGFLLIKACVWLVVRVGQLGFPMRLAHHLLLHSSGVFHFRLMVPADLRPRLGLSVLKRSLRTRDPATARIFAYTLSARYAAYFLELRRAVMPKPPTIAEILARVGEQDGRRFEIERDAHTGAVTRLRTDGSPSDNAAGLEAMKILFAQPLPMVNGLSPQPPSSPPAPPAMPIAPPSRQRGEPVAADTRLTLGAAVRLYEQAEAPTLKPNTWAQRQRALRSFVGAIGARTPVADITRPMAARWAHGLMVAEGKKRGISKRTAGNSVSHVAQLFAMLLARGEIQTSNPVKGVVVVSKREKDARRKAGFEWEAFDVKVLQRLFDPKNLDQSRTEHVRWAAVMGLYMGARVGEMAQLFLRDFGEEGGVPCVRITAASDGQTLKTEASERLVPLHPDLIRLGLMERVEQLRAAGEERLFPDMRIDSRAGPGNASSKGFSYYLTQLDIRPRRANGTVGFHGFRKNVIQALQGSGVPEERRYAYVGHERGEQSVHATTYMRPWTPLELTALFPGLKWGEWLDFVGLRALLMPRR